MNEELKVIIPMDLLTMLVENFGRVNSLKRMIKNSKYNIEKQTLIDLFGFEIEGEK